MQVPAVGSYEPADHRDDRREYHAPRLALARGSLLP
jgi:hypothetical protein